MKVEPEDIFSHQCRVHPAYYFDQCCLKTCKNWSGVVESKCLLADRSDCLNSDRGMSDHEIKFFKQYTSIKQVVKTRKQTATKVYAILIFDKFLDYCNSQKRLSMDKNIEKDELINLVLKEYPFNIPDFVINYSLLPYLFDDKVYSAFSAHTGKICAEFSLPDIFCMEAAKISRILRQVQKFQLKTETYGV